ncbi:MAG: hypothetical protein LBG05_01650 [Treponema sp.]|jgi:hypothetical protein|nr:hypothetical protein [Treponema sp.]
MPSRCLEHLQRGHSLGLYAEEKASAWKTPLPGDFEVSALKAVWWILIHHKNKVENKEAGN